MCVLRSTPIYTLGSSNHEVFILSSQKSANVQAEYLPTFFFEKTSFNHKGQIRFSGHWSIQSMNGLHF